MWLRHISLRARFGGGSSFGGGSAIARTLPALWLVATAGAWAQGSGVLRGSVKVVGETTPVPGVVISLLADTISGSRDSRPRLQFTSDPGGGFEVSNVPLGHYSWEAAANGFASAKGELSFGADGNAALNIEIAKLASISGAVLSAGGRPIPGAVVAALPPWRYEAAGTTVDANGRFRIDGLEPGRYLLVAHPGGSRVGSSGEAKGQGWLTTFFPSAGTREGAQAVTVTSGQELTGRAPSVEP